MLILLDNGYPTWLSVLPSPSNNSQLCRPFLKFAYSKTTLYIAFWLYNHSKQIRALYADILQITKTFSTLYTNHPYECGSQI